MSAADAATRDRIEALARAAAGLHGPMVNDRPVVPAQPATSETTEDAATMRLLMARVLHFTTKISVGAVCGGFLLSESEYATLARLAAQPARSLEHTMPADTRTFYGPHDCQDCGKSIVRASRQEGSESFDQPEGPIYPNTEWYRHACPGVPRQEGAQ